VHLSREVAYVPYIMSQVKLEDFATWKAAFGAPEGRASRKAAGAKSWQLFRSKDDANEIMLLIEWDSLDSARKYYHNKEWLERQAKIGVLQLWIHYLEEVEKESA
jgi:heme-degrading monooxygenase HmoA